MARTVAIGIQNFDEMIEKNYFYIDKTSFIKEWWDGGDSVTLITRPRRFGKTLNMSMVEQFFSVDYKDRGDLFEGLKIWEDEEYRKIQGTYPVISLSFARVNETNYSTTREKICEIIKNLYIKFSFLKESDVLTDADIKYFDQVLSVDVKNRDITSELYQLSYYLYRYYGKKTIILLNKYDVPLQAAYNYGYLDEVVALYRSMFLTTFKTNSYMERGILTGITNAGEEPFLSELNMQVVTSTSDKYATSFGFTQEEVFAALDECGFGEQKEEVKRWYDGFIFGKHKDIYNPWSILNFLGKGSFTTYWANTSSDGFVGKLIREGGRGLKEKFENLLRGEVIRTPIDEHIVYNQLNGSDKAIWSLLLASGYLKVLSYDRMELLEPGQEQMYELAFTNYEVECMFEGMIHGWFMEAEEDYNNFIKAMLLDDIDAMNDYMNRVAIQTFSYFDTGRNLSIDEPERFYHGFVLGLMVDLQGRYVITSNRESGFGRYDVVLEPKNPDKDDAIILEFKVMRKGKEASLEDTVLEALKQIEDKQYAQSLIARGIPEERIRKYGFAFEGKRVLIGS